MKKKIAKVLIKGTIKASLGVAVAACVIKINNDKRRLKEYAQLVEDQQRIIRDFQKLMGREVDTE